VTCSSKGQPFHYLEHFEEVPQNNDNNSIQPVVMEKKDSVDNIGKNNNVNMMKRYVVSEPKINNHFSLTQMNCDTTSTDKFQDMISNIMYNIDSSTSSSQTFQIDLQLQNASCSA